MRSFTRGLAWAAVLAAAEISPASDAIGGYGRYSSLSTIDPPYPATAQPAGLQRLPVITAQYAPSPPANEIGTAHSLLDPSSPPYASDHVWTEPSGHESFGCEYPDMCCESRCGLFAGIGGIYMTRDRENFFAFSYDTADESIQLVDSRDAEMQFSGGVEARLGYYFCCGASSVEFVYWQLFPSDQSTSLLGAAVAGDLNGIHNWDDLTYNAQTADNWVDDAVIHRLDREFEFYNFEANWNRYFNPNACGAWQAQALVGFRYLRFGEGLDFSADTVDAVFTGAPEEIHYLVDVENNLLGIQVGGRGERRLTSRLTVSGGLKAGLFANEIDHQSQIGGSAGIAVVNNGPNNGQAFNISSGKTDVAMMAELDLGLGCDLWCNWRLTAGYRLMGLSGVALSTNQIYSDLRGLEDAQLVDSNGSLLLHGAYMTLQYNY